MELKQKIKLIVDHNNKKLRNPKYGYIVGINDAEKVPDGVFVETGLVTSGKVYLIQTSWCSGMLWWTAGAFKVAKGFNQLDSWQKSWTKYLEAHK
jgi:hypothetical protein